MAKKDRFVCTYEQPARTSSDSEKWMNQLTASITESYVIDRNADPLARENKRKKNRCLCIIFTTIVAVLVVGTTALFYFYLFSSSEKDVNSSDNHRTVSRLLDNNSLIIAGNNNFWTFDYALGKFVHFKEVASNIQAFDIHLDKSILWSEENVPVIKRYPENYDITHLKRLKPHAIAIDYVTKNIYVIQKTTGTLHVLDETGKNFNVMLSNLLKPNDFILDVERKMMFIAQQAKSIVRVEMDGTNMVTIIEDNRISNITLDLKSKRLYWTCDYHGIMSSDYHGREQNLIKQLENEFVGIAFSGNKLFWLIPKFGINNATLTTCQIQGNSCKNYVNHAVPFDNPKILKAYSIYNGTERKIANPCDVQDAEKCSDLCLLSIYYPHTCACKLGWRLNEDKRTCKIAPEYLLFLEGNVVRTKFLDSVHGDTFSDAILPFELKTEPLLHRETIDIDYNYKTHSLYFADDINIKKVNLINDEEEEETLVRGGFNNETFTDIAFDWISDNLYYAIKSPYHRKHLLLVLNLKSNRTKTVKSFARNSNPLYACPYSLILNPNLGKLYGTNLVVKYDIWYSDIISNFFSWEIKINFVNTGKVLAVDYKTDRIYYIYNRNTEYIYECNSILSSPKSIKLNISMANVTSIYVHENHLYIGNFTGIWRFDKVTGGNPLTIISKNSNSIEPKLSALKVFSPKIQTVVDESDYCKAEDCEQICFAKPRKTCACMDGQSLKDNKQCS